MLSKTSVFMMLLAASLIGISSIHQHVEGQIATTPLTELTTGSALGNVLNVESYAPVAGCTAVVVLPSDEPNPFKLPPGTPILLFSERENNCLLLSLVKMEEKGRPIFFKAQKIPPSSLPTAIRGDLGSGYPLLNDLYRVFSVAI